MPKLKDLTGQRFGRLTVIERAENNGKKTCWRCRCDCGNVCIVQSGNLTNGHTQSCHCLNQERNSESKLKDLTGMKFGRLTVIERIENKNKKTCWRCRCDCGNEISVISTNLTQAHTQSCGCLHDETASKMHIKHALCHTKIYRTWASIKDRCLKPQNKSYKNYGGRGITMCPAWIDDFLAFCNYVSTLEHFGEEGYSLDRIDNDGNYEPGNLRWANRKTQGRNTRRNVSVEYEGVIITLSEAAELSGINYGTLHSRFNVGDRAEKLFRPVKNSSRQS